MANEPETIESPNPEDLDIGEFVEDDSVSENFELAEETPTPRPTTSSTTTSSSSSSEESPSPTPEVLEMLDDPEVTGPSTDLLTDPEVVATPNQNETAREFNPFGVAVEESLRTIGTNFFLDELAGEQLESAIGDIGHEQPGITSGVASGIGQAGGDAATILAFGTAGAAAGLAGGPFAPATSAAGFTAGAAIGTTVVFGQGMRREMTQVYNEVKQRGGSTSEGFIAIAKATPGTVMGEMLDLVKFGRLVPQKFRRNLIGVSLDATAEVAGEAIERVGRFKRILFGAGEGAINEGLGEGIQFISSKAAVESTLDPNKGFFSEAAKATKDPQLFESIAVGGITGFAVRGTIDTFGTGLEVIDEMRNVNLLEDQNRKTLQLAQSVTELLDESTSTESVNIPSDVASPKQVRQAVETEGGLDTQVAEDGSTNIIKEGQRVEPTEETVIKGFRGSQGDPSAPGLGGAKFFSPNKEVAESFATESGTVVSEDLKITNPLRTRNFGTVKQDLGLLQEASMEDVINEARNQEYDYILFESINNTPEIVQLNPGQEATSKQRGVPPALTIGEIIAEEANINPAVRAQLEALQNSAQILRNPPPGVDFAAFNTPDPEIPGQNLEALDNQTRSDSKLPDKGESIKKTPRSNWREQSIAKVNREDPTLDPIVKLPFKKVGSDKNAVSGFVYLPVKNRDLQAAIQEKIKQNGMQNSIFSYLMENDRLELRQHSALGVELQRNLKQEIIKADQEGRTEDAEQFRQLQENLAISIMNFGTDAGQSIQYLRQLQQATNGKDVLRLHTAALKKVAAKSGTSWKNLDKDTQEKIVELGEKLIKAPEDSDTARRIQRDILGEIAAVQLQAGSILEAIWYANVLSGVNTQAINLFGSGSNLFLRTLGAGFSNVNDLRSVGAMFTGMVKAQKRALLDVRAALAGEDISRSISKIQAPGALELIMRRKNLDPETVADHLKNWGITGFGLGRFVFRLLSAGDAYFFRTGAEAQAHFVASKMIREKGLDLNKQQFAAALSEQLNNSTQKYQAAQKKAKTELEQVYTAEELKELNIDRLVDRRAFEIIEQSRPDILQKEASRFGQMTTFTQPPEGSIGVFVTGVNSVVNRIRIKGPGGTNVRPVKFVIPFTNIVGNVVSSSLDFTPIGTLRAATGDNLLAPGPKKATPKGQPPATGFSAIERNQRLGASLLGTTVAAATLAIFENFLDEEDPFPELAIYGKGPPFGSRAWGTFKGMDGEPFSIKIGDTFIKYNETPLAPLLSVIAGWHDAIRFKKGFNEKDLGERVVYGITMAAASIGEQSFLKGVSDLFTVLTDPDRKNVGDLGKNIAKGFVPFAGLARDIAKFTDPELVDRKESYLAALIADIPYAQRFGTRPKLNVFGEPITVPVAKRIPGISRVISRASTDPVWKFMADKGLGIAKPAHRISIGVTSPTKDLRAEIDFVKESRARTMGRFAYGNLTKDEHYEFTERSGPLIKDAVREIILNSDGKDRTELQGEIDEAVKKARRDVKMDMISTMFDVAGGQRVKNQSRNLVKEALEGVFDEESAGDEVELINKNIPQADKTAMEDRIRGSESSPESDAKIMEDLQKMYPELDDIDAANVMMGIEEGNSIDDSIQEQLKGPGEELLFDFDIEDRIRNQESTPESTKQLVQDLQKKFPELSDEGALQAIQNIDEGFSVDHSVEKAGGGTRVKAEPEVKNQSRNLLSELFEEGLEEGGKLLDKARIKKDDLITKGKAEFNEALKSQEQKEVEKLIARRTDQEMANEEFLSDRITVMEREFDRLDRLEELIGKGMSPSEAGEIILGKEAEDSEREREANLLNEQITKDRSREMEDILLEADGGRSREEQLERMLRAEELEAEGLPPFEAMDRAAAEQRREQVDFIRERENSIAEDNAPERAFDVEQDKQQRRAREQELIAEGSTEFEAVNQALKEAQGPETIDEFLDNKLKSQAPNEDFSDLESRIRKERTTEEDNKIIDELQEKFLGLDELDAFNVMFSVEEGKSLEQAVKDEIGEPEDGDK